MQSTPVGTLILTIETYLNLKKDVVKLLHIKLEQKKIAFFKHFNNLEKNRLHNELPIDLNILIIFLL